MSRAWSFLPEEATPFMLAAQNPPNAQGDTETLGRELLRLVVGPAGDGGNPAAALTEDQLRHRASEAMVRTGLDVLEHGLLPVPDVLTYDMAIPVACWKAGQCAVVLIVRFSRHRPGEPAPVALPVTYSRGPDGHWQAPAHTYLVGGGFSHDPIANPGSQRHLGGNPVVYGSTQQAAQVTPGYPAFIATGSVAPEVRYLAVVQDGHEDRRPLESHFGAWIVCTEQPGPLDVAGLGESGDVLARLPHSSRAGPRDTTVR